MKRPPWTRTRNRWSYHRPFESMEQRRAFLRMLARRYPNVAVIIDGKRFRP